MDDFIVVDEAQDIALKKISNHNHRALFKILDSKYPGHDYSKLLERITRHGEESLRSEAYKVKDKEDFKFVTLAHGDPWFNNMMFQNKDHVPCDPVLFDFQLCYYGGAALDLVYFLSISVAGEVRRRHQDHMLTVYHTTLTNTLRMLGADFQYSFEDLGKY